MPTLDKHYIHIAQAATLPKRMETLAKFKPPVELKGYQFEQFAATIQNQEDLHP